MVESPCHEACAVGAVKGFDGVEKTDAALLHEIIVVVVWCRESIFACLLVAKTFVLLDDCSLCKFVTALSAFDVLEFLMLFHCLLLVVFAYIVIIIYFRVVVKVLVQLVYCSSKSLFIYFAKSSPLFAQVSPPSSPRFGLMHWSGFP